MDGKAQREGASSGKTMTVTMEVDTLDCPICFEPLRPPIFQCSVGHFICSSCRGKHPHQKCHLCSTKTSFKRCFGMEHVVQSVKVPCSSAIYGCTEMVPYYQKEEHEKVCHHPWGLFCPVPICTSFGPPEALLEHLTTEHQLPSTTLPDSGTVSLHLQQGLHALGRNGASYLFLLSLTLLPVGHAISIICVQLNDIEPKFTCNMSFESFTTGFSESSSFHIRNDSLSDGYPTGYDLILPEGKFPNDKKKILLTITIHQALSVSGSCLQGKGPAASPEQNTPFEYYSDDSDDHEDDDDERGQLMLLKKIQALSVIRSSLQEKGLIPAPQRPKIIQGSLGLAIERNIFRD